MKLPRVWRRIDEWEEVPANMWGTVSDASAALEQATEFTSNHAAYGVAMADVVKCWQASCENALTDRNLAQRAWLGHAAVAKKFGIPEDITRKAWAKLTDEQRFLANREAERYINQWRWDYRQSRGLCENMDKPMLF